MNLQILKDLNDFFIILYCISHVFFGIVFYFEFSIYIIDLKNQIKHYKDEARRICR